MRKALLASVCCLPALAAYAQQGTVQIAAGASIQAAVNAHPAGTAFVLAPGNYGGQTVSPLSGDSFSGPGAALTGNGSGSAFALNDAQNVTITDLSIADYDKAILATGSSNNTITDNTITASGTAAVNLGAGSDNNTIAGNTIDGVSGGPDMGTGTNTAAVWITGGSSNTINQNNISNTAGVAIGLSNWDTNPADTANLNIGNQITGNTIVNANNSPQATDSGGIYEYSVSGVNDQTVITGNTIGLAPHAAANSNSAGIYLDDDTSGVTATGNTVTGAVNGWIIHGGQNNTITGNAFNIAGFSQAIPGGPVTMTNNTVSGNTIGTATGTPTPAPTSAAAAAPVASPDTAATAPTSSASCTTSPVSAVNALYSTASGATGTFSTVNGQFIGPNGQAFVAKGLNVYDSAMGDAQQILADFPGINFIRLNVYSYQSPAAYSSFMQTMTAAGVVVEVEDHTNSSGEDAGGGSGPNNKNVAYTGQQLTNELNWYSAMASAYANDPYVWFGTDNEPPTAGLSTWEQETYQAIRNTGNANPILMELPGGGPTTDGLTPSTYAGMTNIAWDAHFYGWVVSGGAGNTDQQAVDQALEQEVAGAQAITSASGTMPVIIGETGNSTNGQTVDPNGDQVITAVTTSNLGAAFWNFNSEAGADNLTAGGSMTSYGQQVAQWVATAAGCQTLAVSASAEQAAVAAGQAAVDQANSLSVAQVAALAAQGQTADGQSTASTLVTAAAASPASVADIAAQAATGAAPGGTLAASDPATAAVLASGPVTAAQPLVLTQDAPGGTMPTPAPVSTSTAVNVAGDNQTFVASPGNGVGTIAGADNVVNASGGMQTLAVTGSGNQITTGPYNDTVTVSASGNTINLGGGANTVVLAYAGEAQNQQTNADAAALPPLAGAGNVFVAPQPGTGTLTIQGTLAQGDTIDLTQALASTTWDHQASDMWNYVTAAASSSGCTLSVNGQVIVTLLNGSPSGNIGPFIAAH